MKNQWIWIALIGVLLASVPAVTAQTVATNPATISAGVVRGIPGSTVNLPLALSHTGIVSAVQYELSYNPARMTAGILSAEPLTNTVSRSRQIAPGVHRVLVYRTGPVQLATKLEFGSLPFSVPAGQLSGGGHVTITNVLAATPSATPVFPVGLLHGAVLVEPLLYGADGLVGFFLTVQSNRTYVVQASTNLVNWVNLSTNFATQDYVIARDTAAAAYPLRFYRAVSTDGGQIGSAQLLSGGLLTFSYPSTAGRLYVLQVSTNLNIWENLTTNVAAGGVLGFTNAITPANPQRFFRVLELP